MAKKVVSLFQPRPNAVYEALEKKEMRLITTEAQRHRENVENRDPRTSPVIGAGPGSLESACEDESGEERNELSYQRNKEETGQGSFI